MKCFPEGLALSKWLESTESWFSYEGSGIFNGLSFGFIIRWHWETVKKKKNKGLVERMGSGKATLSPVPSYFLCFLDTMRRTALFTSPLFLKVLCVHVCVWCEHEFGRGCAMEPSGSQRIRPTVSSLMSLWVLGIELGLSGLCGLVCFSGSDKMLWPEASEKRKGFYLLTLPDLNPSCRELRAETEAESMEEYCLPSLSLNSPLLSLLSYTTRPVCMNDVPTVDWALPHQCQSRHHSQTWPQASWWARFFSKVF